MRFIFRMTVFSIFMTVLLFSTSLISKEYPYTDGIRLDCDFPGGNIIVTGRTGDQILLKPDLRDTKGDWFYTAFRVRGAQGKTLHFKFDKECRVGSRGPAVSSDGEKTWQWLSDKPHFDSKKFSYTFRSDEKEVLFALAPLYTQKNWDQFIAQYKGVKGFKPDVLCKSRKGTNVELLRIGPRAAGKRSAEFGIALSARHHCCEMMANYVLEGIIEETMSATETGNWLRANCDFLIVPFMDKPGVEAGDQGKNRIPHDQNRDYIQEIYPAVKNYKKRILSDFAQKRVFFLDLHCPWIRGGDFNERLYSPSVKNPKFATSLREFSLLLEEEQKNGAIPYKEQYNLPFGVQWNTDANYKRPAGEPPTMPAKEWGQSIPNALFSGDFEIPYANASETEVNPQTARELGRAFARAMARFLKGRKKGSELMQSWLLQKIDESQTQWIDRYEKIKTKEDIAVYQKERREYFIKQLGPLWKKSPLRPKILGTVKKDGYRIEKILFESLPNFFVTADLYLPDDKKFSPPYPAVLSLMGHNFEGKIANRGVLFSIACARNGLAVFAIDPIDQGERLQHIDENGKPYASCCSGHNLIGASSILLGRNTATFEIWDMFRSLDYLDSRSDIIHGRYGAAGASGGGTQTAYIMALDDRIAAAAPACYICNLFDRLPHEMGPQDAEQNIFGQLRFGIDHPDFAIMRAPSPVLLAAATGDMFNIEDTWKTFRYIKRIYTRFSLAERAELIETDFFHQYSIRLREGTLRWMLRWLAGRDEPVVERENEKIPEESELNCLTKPGITTLPNFRTTYDINRDLAEELKAKRKQIWQNMTSGQAADLVRRTADFRKYNEIPAAIPANRKIDSFDCLLETEKNIFLPYRSNLTNSVKSITVCISDKGRFSDRVNSIFSERKNSCFAVDLRGWGETQGINSQYYLHKWHGTDGSDYYMAYLLGKSYIGMRTEDLLAVVKFIKKQYNGPAIRLVAEGSAAIIALHAAVAEPALFESVEIDEKTLPSWNELIVKSPISFPLTDCIHGVLSQYDTTDLLTLIRTAKQKTK